MIIMNANRIELLIKSNELVFSFFINCNNLTIIVYQYQYVDFYLQ